VKKEKTLKYLILTLTLIISFFMFSNASVKAAETKGVEIVDNLFFEVEEIETGNYSIVGVYNTCDGDSVCLQSISSVQNLVIPDVYNDGENDYPIISIKDSSSNITGVLEDLSLLVRGKISGGNNLVTIGTCAFCGFQNVTEIDVSSSVTLIKNNAFFGSGIKILNLNRYDNTSESHKITAIESEDVFSGVALDAIVFKNSSVLRYYRDNNAIWKDLDRETLINKFTFRITYRFYDGEGDYEDRIYFSGKTLGSVPEDLVKVGFDFGGWLSNEFEGEYITFNSVATILNSNLAMIHEVNPVWELSSPELVIETFYKGVKDEDNKIIYSGNGNELDIVVSVDHDLISEEEFAIAYSWESNIKSIVNVIAGNVSNLHSIGFVSQSGIYTCYVDVSYLGYTKKVYVSLPVEIIPKDLIINVNDNRTEYGTYVGAGKVNDTYFEIDDSTSLIQGEVIKDYIVDVYTNSGADLTIGEYNDVLSVQILNIGYDGSSDNYINNYHIIYNNGDLTIVKKNIDVSLVKNIDVVYGDIEVLTRNINDVVYVSDVNPDGINNNIVVTYQRSDASVKDVGEYRVVSAIVDNENYDVAVDLDNQYRIIIMPKNIDVRWAVDSNLVYNGEEKSISASYVDIANQVIDLKVTITKDDENTILVNAGNYVAVAEMIVGNNNYVLSDYEYDVVIEKADTIFVGEERQTKVYNGYPQRVDVSLNHHETVPEYGDYSTCKNAHVSSIATCTITVTAKETANYKSNVTNFYLHINPYKLIVEPDLFTITYGTRIGIDNLNKRYSGLNGESVIVYFYKEGTSSSLDVGYYNVGGANLSNTTNYVVEMVEGSGVNKIRILPAPITIRFVDYENLVYDGNVKDVKIRIIEEISEDVGVQVDYNGKQVIKNAGDYRVSVSLSNPNYYIEGKDYVDFTIAKANYDISSLKLSDKKVAFNFKNHFINLEGDLPEGLTAVYSINGNDGNGTFAPSKHIVKVTFIGDYENYNYIEPLTAVLNISMTWLWVVLVSFIVVVGGGTLVLVFLVKTGKIRLKNRIKRSKIRKIVKRNKELDAINLMIIKKKEELYKKEENDQLIIEEPVKFVKNPVNVSPEELISLSFVDELFRSDYSTKNYYSEVKNELLSYEGVVSKIKRDYETFYLNNMPIAKLDVVNGVLQTYFALDPALYKKEEYNHEDVSKQKDFAAVPLHLTVNSIESLRHAKMFVRIIRKKEKIKFASNYIRTDYVKIYTAKDTSFKLFKKVFTKKKKEN